MIAQIFQCLSGSYQINLLGTGLADPTVFVESDELDTVVNNLANKGFSIEFPNNSLCFA